MLAVKLLPTKTRTLTHGAPILTPSLYKSPFFNMNTWEHAAFEQYPYPSSGQLDTQEALFYPGVYSTGEYDVLGILAAVNGRPNPQIHLGAVDTSCALIICDLTQPDHPIVYASPYFYDLTGYSAAEVKGRNCRFLQAPGGKVKPKSTRKHVDKDSVRKMRKAVEKRTELQIEVVNFQKNGQRFINVLTMIPVVMDGREYCVGFQCEKE